MLLADVHSLDFLSPKADKEENINMINMSNIQMNDTNGSAKNPSQMKFCTNSNYIEWFVGKLRL